MISLMLYIVLLFWQQITAEPDSGAYEPVLETTDSVEPLPDVERLVQLSREHVNQNVTLALEYAQRAVLEAESEYNTELQYQAYMNLGYVAFSAGLYEVAIHNYGRILSIIGDEDDDLEKTGRLNYSIGVTRLVLEDYEAAEEYLRLGMEQIERAAGGADLLSTETRLIFANNLGVVYLGLDRLTEAEEVLSEGLQLIHGSQTAEVKSHIQLLHNLADTYSRKSSFNESVKFLQKADQLLSSEEGQGLYLLKSMIYILWGQVMEKTGDMNQAGAFYYSAYRLALQTEGLSHIKHASARLSDYYKAINKPDSAIYYATISERYDNKQRIRQAGEELARLELLSQFRQTQAMLSREYERKTRLYTIASLLLLLLIILMYVLYNRTKKRYSDTAKEKNVLAESFQKTKKESETLKIKVVEAERENMLRTLQMAQSKEKLRQIIREASVDASSNGEEPGNSKSADQLTTALKKSLYELKWSHGDRMWKEFETKFKAGYGDFDERLNDKYPDLTANERRLCAFIRMDMNTKEIATITGQTKRAVEIARSRLRKKMNLTGTGTNLSVHIRTI